MQYALIYTSKLEEAVTDKEVELVERNAFHNPDVSMSTVDMVSYAMKVWNSPARYRSTFTTQNKMTMRLNNIYVVADHRAEASPGIGSFRKIQERLQKHHCPEENDFS